MSTAGYYLIIFLLLLREDKNYLIKLLIQSLIIQIFKTCPEGVRFYCPAIKHRSHKTSSGEIRLTS